MAYDTRTVILTLSDSVSVQKLSEFFGAEEIETESEPYNPTTPAPANNQNNIKSVVSTIVLMFLSQNLSAFKTE